MEEKVIRKTIEMLVHLPHDYHKVDKSEFSLLEESGYFKLHDRISEKEISEVLKMHPHLIAEWAQFSADSRSETNWVFSQGESGKYYVSHWPPNPEFDEVSSFDRYDACAAFVKRKAESTRIIFEK